jgi:hypothetical protein
VISSEVQRTLVKSPPELWTELSDPESLARHLGELGEIRITRTEPENLVEWEAEGTTGTVEITPSGWGTRVTLTVLRELSAEEGADAPGASPAEPQAETVAPESPAEPQAAIAQPEAGEPGEGETEPAAEAPAAERAPEATPAPGPEAAERAEATPEAGAAAVSMEPTTERKPAPATEAARRAAGWPSAHDSYGPAIESDLRAAEAVEGSPPEPDGLHEWAMQSAEAPDAEPDEDSRPALAKAAATEPPKRGFFARLFGRRRDREKKAIPPAEEPAGVLDDPIAALAAETEAFGEPEAPAGEFDDERLDAAAAEEPPDEEIAPQEPLAAADQEDPFEEAPEQIGHAEPALDELAEPADAEIEPAAPADETELGAEIAAEPAAPDHAEGKTEPQAEATVEPATPVVDLAAELRAAEEVAAEQVEAVLTGVLDRLGAAHHRPFSRA